MSFQRFNFSLDPKVVAKARELVPRNKLSRLVERLLKEWVKERACKGDSPNRQS